MDDLLDIIVDGQEIQGRFTHRSRTSIEVEILAPYPSFTRELHMPHFSKTTAPDGFEGPEGITRGKELLRNLYRLCDHIATNLSMLLSAYRDYERKATEVRSSNIVNDMLMDAFRRSMRQEAKEGKITEATYLRRMTDIRVRHSDYHYRLWKLKQQFFRSNFPLKVDDDVKEQVLLYLKRANRR